MRAIDKLEIIRKMVEDNPHSAAAWYLLGTEYIQLQLASEALHAFSEALKLGDAELKEKILGEIAKLSTPAEKPRVNDNLNLKDNTINDDDDYNDNDDTDDRKGRISLKVIDGGKQGHVIDLETRREEQVTFAQVGGLEELKDVIRMKIIKPFTNPRLFSRFKKKTGGGILLYGPPGCGKTFIAKATAGECQARFMPVHITDILDPYLGVSEQNLREIFTTARAHKPGVLFFDEIDAIGFHRGKSASTHLRPVVDQLLAEMEGIDTNTDKLLVIGATNMPWDVDPAFKRPGRFDKMVFVPPPDERAREEIFRLKLTDRPCAKMDYAKLAQQTEFYSGADIENSVEVATEKVIAEIMRSGQERLITMDDLLSVIKQTSPSTIEWLRTVRNYVKYANQGGLYDDVEKYLAKHKRF